MFGEFVEVLDKDEWLLVFAEGSHFLGFTLRPVQKGTARIAFSAQEAQGWTKEIPIIPAGLQYDSHTAFGSRLLLQYGPPISTLAFKEAHQENPKKAERALTERLFQEMRRLVVVFPAEPEAYAATLEEWRRSRGEFSDLMEQFRADKERFEGPSASGTEASPRALDPKTAFRRLAGLLSSSPGILMHLPVLLVIVAWEKLLIQDLHLKPAARFAEGMFLVPLWYVLAAALCFELTRSWPWVLLCLALLPASLWAWSRTWHWVRD